MEQNINEGWLLADDPEATLYAPFGGTSGGKALQVVFTSAYIYPFTPLCCDTPK